MADGQQRTIAARRYVGGRSWSELLANYTLFEGRVWVAVLAWVAIAPYVFFRLKSPGR